MRPILAGVATTLVLGLVGWLSQNSATTPSSHEKSSSGTSGERRDFASCASRSDGVVLDGALFPRLSPDGATIAFSRQGAIWTISRTGGSMTRLTRESGFDIEPVWSPGGRRIAYVNSASFGPGSLRVIQSDSGQSVPLPRPMEVGGTNVYQKLEFLSDTRILGVFRVTGQPLGLGWFDLESGESKLIFSVPRWGRYALSQDRTRIAYSSTLDAPGQQNGNDGRENDIFEISIEGGIPKKIIGFPSRVYDLTWTPDDSGLIIVSDFGNAQNDLWQIPLSDPERGMQRMTHGQADEDRPSVARGTPWMVYTDNRRSTTSLMVRDLRNAVDREVQVDQTEYQQPVGTLDLNTHDKLTRKSIVTRVSVQALNGKMSAPPKSLYRALGTVPHFYNPGTSTWDLPAGQYVVRVFRGPEYIAYRGQIDVRAGQTTELAVDLERWTDPASKGWYSGENHIHANYGYGQWYNDPRSMLEQCSGEDLRVCNFMVANSDTDAVFDREFFRGRLDPVSTSETLLYWNQEFRSTIWGHMTLVNLKQVVEPVFTGFKGTTNPWDIPTNSQIADRVHWQKGLVNYTHVAQNPADPYENPYTGKGIPIDVALGKIDTLDLNASYAGTIPLWYRLLNCGFRLPASAGTDTFLNRVASRLPGGDRVYVKLAGPLNYQNWIEGLRSGHSFVSNGPILDFTVENVGPGASLDLGTPRSVSCIANATSQFPLEKVEVVFNGQVVATAQISADKTSASLKEAISISRSGWLSLRAAGPGHPDHPVGTLDAHTSPVYVTVGGKPTGSKEDAEYFLKWIDRLSLAIKVRDRIPDPKLRQEVEAQFEAARAVYAEPGQM